jgi:predicted O-linked N-acetylglucosamine transferase (SPINDLY family)
VRKETQRVNGQEVPVPTAAAAFDLAARHFQAGSRPEAERALRALLAEAPDHAPALRLLGQMAYERGRPAEALAFFRRAADREPANATLHSLVGAAHQALGQLDEAEASHRRALALAPGDPLVLNNLGITLAARGRAEEAVDAFERARAADPRDAEVLCNLAAALQGQGRLGEAAALCHEAIRLAPGLAHAHNTFGRVLQDQGRLAEAEACYRRALGANPDFAEAHNNLGNAVSAQGRLDEAAACYAQTLGRRSDWSVPHYNLGVTLQSQGRLVEARACIEHALALNPDDPVAYSTYVGSLHYDPEASPALLLAEHRRWAERQASRLPEAPAHANDPDPERRLRVGYVSPDFRNHAAAFFLEPLLTHHDPGRVETVCYAELAVPDERTAQLRGLARHWRPTRGLSDERLAAQVREDGIDILVDLAGHTAGNRLLAFARRPAPVQVSYLGYPGTTGLDAVAYRLADAVTDPPEEAPSHSEELVRLPGPFCCYAPPARVPLSAALPSRRQRAVTFGSLHKLDKLNGRVVDLWCRLLHDVPGARLLLARNTLHGPTADYWRDQFTRRGIAPEQLVIRRVEPVGMQHLRAYDEVDVLLDTFPWCGHTTACEALWMGVPVITLRGDRHAGRMTASVLTCLGLTELIADTAEDYRRIGAALAKSVPRRAVLRGGLRGRLSASPLCDGAAFTRNLEVAYRRMWRRWCEGQRQEEKALVGSETA